MKTVFSSHAELCHQFAANPFGYGRSSRMSFDDGALYSYSTAIIRVLDHNGTQYLLINDTSYSSSSAKHFSHAIRAVSHYETKFRVGNLHRGERLRFGDVGLRIHEYAMDRAAECKRKSVRARSNKEYLIRDCLAWLAEADRASKLFGLGKSCNEDELSDLVRQKEEAAKEHAESMREARRRREELDKADRAEAEIEMQKWILGEPCTKNRMFHELPIACRTRANKMMIETSNGAVIPYDAGRVAFDVWNGNATLAGNEQIGQYKINSVSPEYLRVGCTTIMKPEIERFAKQEGWI